MYISFEVINLNLSFDWYNVFYYVCEFKSVTKAANFLYVSQPAITKNIRNLEKSIGKKLIFKTPSGIELTHDGEELYKQIKESIEKLNLITSSLKIENDKYNEIININCGVSSVKKYLLNNMSEFNKKYPKLKFIIKTVDADISIRQLEEGKVDLIFLTEEVFTKNNSKNNNIIFVPWKVTSECLVVSNEVKKDYPDFIKIEDLNKYPLMLKNESSSSRVNIEKIFKSKGLQLEPTYQLSSHWLIEEYVKMGLGIGIVIDHLVDDKIKCGEFVKIETDCEFDQRVFGYAYRVDSAKTKIVKEFVDRLS